MLVACHGYCMEMTLLLIHIKYQYIRSILQSLHDVCTICTISSYELGTILCLIETVNMEFYIIKIITHEFVFWHHWLGIHFVSLHFCWHYILCFFPCPQSTYLLHLCASQICSTFTICHSFLVLNWDPHRCCGQDMLFYNCYTGKQILIIVLNNILPF